MSMAIASIKKPSDFIKHNVDNTSLGNLGLKLRIVAFSTWVGIWGFIGIVTIISFKEGVAATIEIRPLPRHGFLLNRAGAASRELVGDDVVGGGKGKCDHRG
ncbi:hypothetical protein ACH5RR_026138 [Cinchona calisaya]|uniref:Uncharacterized protein n=1 Tax=Cinchona calisaya TaxID=153742 RepID=A0ABD2Z1Z2_9GENT